MASRAGSSRVGLPFVARARAHTRGALAGALLATTLGCSQPLPARAARPTPISDEAAVSLIASVVVEQGARAERGVPQPLANGAVLPVDVGVEGRRLGVALLSETERQRLVQALPRLAERDEEALFVVQGRATDPYARVLVLQARNYLSDPSDAAERQLAWQAAEGRLARDVRDFFFQASARGWGQEPQAAASAPATTSPAPSAGASPAPPPAPAPPSSPAPTLPRDDADARQR